MSYADVNGLSMYYEEHGDAPVTEDNPALVLLHGGLFGSQTWAPILPALAAGRRVITADLQGHSRTADIDRPIRVETLGDDVAALIGHLGLGRADVMGYSFGGGTALRCAIQHPEVVRKLVVVSFPFRQDGFFPDVQEQQRQMSAQTAVFMKETPIWELYERTAPRLEDFPQLVGKMSDWLRQPFDYSEEIRALRVPTQLIFADADMYSMQHIADFWALLGGGLRDAGWDGAGRPGAHRLAILPDTTHYGIFESAAMVEAADRFLSA
ncbi:alpha/beta hydrolase [Catenulispora sp. NF23]|uniref:Alpha/beta hydrolase n=1 Tax=Catenulispora pinistramenti TaxID=2705254 RepID=A0ABS5KMI9_9ACTN|nr:alpha/beta hydrolase [Catenulispora pinistramenti]MBS2537669.1 alpha/beta hydrolase [Catenulispora pinistramenti]MBS2547236.1 alpha/beta hydrolase [Catenulispora pinistramenti]